MVSIKKIDLNAFTDLVAEPLALKHGAAHQADSTALDEKTDLPLPTLTQSDLDAAYQQGFSDGKAHAYEDKTLALTNDQNSILKSIQDTLTQQYHPVLTQSRAFEKTVLEKTGMLVTSLLNRLREPLLVDHITTLIQQIPPRHTGIEQGHHSEASSPHLAIKLNPDQYVQLSEILKTQLGHDKRFSEIDYSADRALSPGDCRIEWDDGAITHRFDRALDQIDETLTNFQHPACEVE